MTTLSYRRATARDMPWAYQLFRTGMKDYIEQTWGWDEVFQHHSFMENIPPARFTVINNEVQDIGGYCLKRVDGSHLQLELLIIAPVWRKQGLGTLVMQELMRQASKGRLPLQLKVLKTNPAITFYRRLGFAIHEEDRDRYCLSWTPE